MRNLQDDRTRLTRHRIPPVVSKGYQAKGGYQTINGLKTCKWDTDAPEDHIGCKDTGC